MRGDLGWELGRVGRWRPDLLAGDPREPCPLGDRPLELQRAAFEQTVRADDPVADRVEGPRRHAHDARGDQPLLQLLRCRVVEGHAEDPLRRRAAGEQLAHALDEHGRLAGARRRDHLDDAARRSGRGELRCVERLVRRRVGDSHMTHVAAEHARAASAVARACTGTRSPDRRTHQSTHTRRAAGSPPAAPARAASRASNAGLRATRPARRAPPRPRTPTTAAIRSRAGGSSEPRRRPPAASARQRAHCTTWTPSRSAGAEAVHRSNPGWLTPRRRCSAP